MSAAIPKKGAAYSTSILQQSEISPNAHQSEVNALAERLYARMLTVMAELPQLRVEDYDLPLIKETLIVPVAQYLHEAQTVKTSRAQFVKPIFVSGDPGIGKTTLLMILDETLQRLPNAGSARNIINAGEITGYFAYKKKLTVSPLKLFEKGTAALSARDWNNILRHWTYDEDTFRESEKALSNLIQQLRGKVIIVDEAEMEGYVYFAETMAQRGILILFTSNLGAEHIHLAKDRFNAVRLTGIDHRNGDISKVCLPHGANFFMDRLARLAPVTTPLLASANHLIQEIQGLNLVYLKWDDLRNQPLMKDDFGHFFKAIRAEYVMLDNVPFLTEIDPRDINLTWLGHLSRFVNFVDAIHDCALPLLVRGTHESTLDPKTAGQTLEAALLAYDIRTGGMEGRTAMIEWGRCLSRLRSREALNQRLK